MTQNEVRKYIEELREKARLFGKSGFATAGMEKAFNKSANTIENLLNELESYRAMEQRLKNAYGECDGLLEVVVRHLENHETIDFPNNITKAKLLTDKDVDKWEGYKSIGTLDECNVKIAALEEIVNLVKCEQSATTCEYTQLKTFDMIKNIIEKMELVTYKCRFCSCEVNTTLSSYEEDLRVHLQIKHKNEFTDEQNLESPDMIEQCFDCQLDNKMYITGAQIEKLKKSYKWNRVELHEVAHDIDKYGMTDHGLSDVSASFEQGYNNAFEKVFDVLGITYEG